MLNPHCYSSNLRKENFLPFSHLIFSVTAPKWYRNAKHYFGKIYLIAVCGEIQAYNDHN